jgi:6,7-dimethyl-8-ribityllumazine synthase
MLKPISDKSVKARGGAFAIVASQYNAKYVDSMLQAAERELNAAGADSIQIVRVPGAFEIPIVVAKLAGRQKPSFTAILCLGVVIRGETAHAQLIGEGVSMALAQLQISHQIPVIHGVLLLENEAQAKARCLDPKHNRGLEAARTALTMAQVMRDLTNAKRDMVATSPVRDDRE